MHDNKLWEGHRLILPEMREKALTYCRDCRFFVQVQGREEVRRGCLAGVPAYGTLQKRVPPKISYLELLKMAGPAGANKILESGNPDAQSCGLFKHGYKPKPGAVREASGRFGPPGRGNGY
ncbi:MAG: hypothetical protein WC364_06900 [Eubacteriales bacterium]|jgi:hypothetical protein